MTNTFNLSFTETLQQRGVYTVSLSQVKAMQLSEPLQTRLRKEQMTKKYETGNLAALVTPKNLRSIKGINLIKDAINEKLKELELPILHIHPSMLKYADIGKSRYYFVGLFVDQINIIEKKVKLLNSKYESTLYLVSPIFEFLSVMPQINELNTDMGTLSTCIESLNRNDLNDGQAHDIWLTVRAMYVKYSRAEKPSSESIYPQYKTASQKKAFEKAIATAISLTIPIISLTLSEVLEPIIAK